MEGDIEKRVCVCVRGRRRRAAGNVHSQRTLPEGYRSSSSHARVYVGLLSLTVAYSTESYRNMENS